jgi:L-erythro-3,5-diaminohexanoate dehydrogenase
MYDKINAATGGKMADVVFNCVNTPRSEMGSILACRNRGTVYLFSMATSFQAAALGAEAIGADVDIMIGNGYADDHARYALQLVKDNPKLREILEGLHE